MVESALVTWVGLLLLGIANVAPHGHITVNILRPPTAPSFADINALQTHMDIGYIMMNIIPVFFVSITSDLLKNYDL